MLIKFEKKTIFPVGQLITDSLLYQSIGQPSHNLYNKYRKRKHIMYQIIVYFEYEEIRLCCHTSTRKTSVG